MQSDTHSLADVGYVRWDAFLVSGSQGRVAMARFIGEVSSMLRSISLEQFRSAVCSLGEVSERLSELLAPRVNQVPIH